MRWQKPLMFILVVSICTVAQAKNVDVAWDGPNTLSMPRANPVIDQGLKTEFSTKSQKAVIPVWIFFINKGVDSQASYHKALNYYESNLTAATRERRMKTRGSSNLADFRDLPVSGNYVSQVIATGVRHRQTLRLFNAVTVEATQEQINEIANMPFVRYIKKIAVCRTSHDVSLEPIPNNSELVTLNYGPSAGQLNQINIVPSHELGFKGQNIIICMMDVGFKQAHTAFQNIINSGRLLAQYDFINHDYNTDFDPSQDTPGQADHGTLTWSTLGGEASGNLYGPSYMASFVLAKTEDISSERHIEEDNWAAGAEWADSIGASVISSSLGYRYLDPGQGDYSYQDLNGHTAIVTQAAQWAALNGITVCNAMGNDGTDGPGSLIAPADADSILSCGAVDGSGTLAYFSSLGPTYDGRIKPEVCAQGYSTVCSDPYNMNGFTTASGTSLSTPLVGGSSGVLLSAHPNWTPVMVREALMMTADRFDTPANDYGWGIMDVSRAMYFHPEGDIIFNHDPILFTAPNSPIAVTTTISGRDGYSISGGLLYFRSGNTGDFTEVDLIREDDSTWAATIPQQSGPLTQYYFKAVDLDSSYAFDPIGGAQHPYSIAIGSSQITDSFEDGPIYWISGGTNNFWGLTAKYAHTGNLSITDSPISDYRNGTNSYLESAFHLDLSGVSSANFSFYWRGVLQSGHDSVFVEASTNGGSAWTRFAAALTGTLNSFTQYNANLSPYLGQPDVMLRFHLVTDGTGTAEGIYIDDISITETRPANISYSPASINDTLNVGDSHINNLIIRNTGNANLIVNLQATEFGSLAKLSSHNDLPHILNTWLFISPTTDTIASGDSLVANVTLNAASLSQGNYSGQISISSNDPDSALSLIPVSLRVGGACQYTRGDANGNGAANGIDVVFDVNYLKGTGPNPPNICDCPPHGQIYAAADANGNCTFNGIDVTYMVNFLKGFGQAPQACIDCPPGP
jgi:hypothetical protein